MLKDCRGDDGAGQADHACSVKKSDRPISAVRASDDLIREGAIASIDERRSVLGKGMPRPVCLYEQIDETPPSGGLPVIVTQGSHFRRISQSVANFGLLRPLTNPSVLGTRCL